MRPVPAVRPAREVDIMNPVRRSSIQYVQVSVAARFASRLLLSLLLGLAFGGPNAWAQQGGPKPVSDTATLTILKGTVQCIAGGGTQAQPATDGMNLAAGDRVLTGPNAEALITFLDGSTLTVMPNGDVAVKQADVGKPRSTIAIRINLGKVWARVVRLADQKSSFSLESNTATATVHDGLIGSQQEADGTFTCWTKAGPLTVTDRQGRTLTLSPGQKAVVKGAAAPTPQPFAVHQSVLAVVASSNVLPLVLMDDEVRVAGFVAPGVEVNQVFGSFTGQGEGGTRTVEVPAGVPGPFTLVLEGKEDGPFHITLSGSFKGTLTYLQPLSGTIAKGQRLHTRINQVLDQTTSGDPKQAKVRSGAASAFTPLAGPLPGKILLAPDELASAGGSR
ncbi:MAG: hypothetical protein EPO61_00725 [Nitrospirae bacterium]|nr:MAG: hypothetical protein EPO61_00725 [Nitrospirota bacterium]